MKTDENYRELTEQEYKAFFQGSVKTPKDKVEIALEHALDIRKFEIELYWKRATYFWTLIGADLVGYGALQVSTTQNESTDNLSILLSCMGIIFSFAWFCANKGSKQWQENWENHVDMLEDETIGPLYKIILQRPEPPSRFLKFYELFTGPGSFSVSKINQIISIFVTILWIVLLFNSLGSFNTKAPVAWIHLIYVFISIACCITFLTFGRTEFKCHKPIAKLRLTKISSTVKVDAIVKDKETSS